MDAVDGSLALHDARTHRERAKIEVIDHVLPFERAKVGPTIYQGSEFSSSDWRSFLKANKVISSMSRRGNCHDNAVAESFFQLLMKRERIRRKIYATRDEARSDIFDYIKMFYNPKRRHGSAMELSPVEYEKRHFLSLESV